MNSLNVGVVGCGMISSIYLQNIPSFAGLKLVACADMKPEVARDQAGRFGIEALSVEDLLAHPGIDVVLNLTIPAAHFPVSLEALKAGKHVYSEKPLAVEVAQGRKLVEEAAARGLLIGSAPDTFLGGAGRLARKLIDDGAIGEVLSGAAFCISHGMEHMHPNPEFFFRRGGGPLLDMGPYYLSGLVNLLGPVARVVAMAKIGFAERVISSDSPHKGERIKVETPTHIAATLEFTSGSQVGLTMSWDTWKHGLPGIELYGSEGSLRVPDPNYFGGMVGISQRGQDWREMDSSDMPMGVPNFHSPFWPATAPYKANYRGAGLAELARVALQGGEHRSSGLLSLHVLEIMHAILESAEAGTAKAIVFQFQRPAAISEVEAAQYWRKQS